MNHFKELLEHHKQTKHEIEIALMYADGEIPQAAVVHVYEVFGTHVSSAWWRGITDPEVALELLKRSVDITFGVPELSPVFNILSSEQLDELASAFEGRNASAYRSFFCSKSLSEELAWKLYNKAKEEPYDALEETIVRSYSTPVSIFDDILGRVIYTIGINYDRYTYDRFVDLFLNRSFINSKILTKDKQIELYKNLKKTYDINFLLDYPYFDVEAIEFILENEKSDSNVLRKILRSTKNPETVNLLLDGSHKLQVALLLIRRAFDGDPFEGSYVEAFLKAYTIRKDDDSFMNPFMHAEDLQTLDDTADKHLKEFFKAKNMNVDGIPFDFLFSLYILEIEKEKEMTSNDYR